MKNKLLSINITDGFSRAVALYYLILFFHFGTFLLMFSHDGSLFKLPFFVFFLFWTFVLRYLYKSLFERSFSYWFLISFITIFNFKNILYFTFIDENFLILYFSFINIMFIVLNIYYMSSPLFFPRVQWWEYDFRFRGDLKVFVKMNNDEFEGRLTDLRRGEGSLDSFKNINLGDKVIVHLNYDSKIHEMNGVVKTKKSLIPGRPIRYGIKFKFESQEEKKNLNQFEKIWNKEKKVKIRKKFINAK